MIHEKTVGRSPLTITAVAAGGAALLGLLLGPVASAASQDAAQTAVRAEARRVAHNGSGSDAVRFAIVAPMTATAADVRHRHGLPGTDSTSYLVGGTVCLTVGALAIMVRRRVG